MSNDEDSNEQKSAPPEPDMSVEIPEPRFVFEHMDRRVNKALEDINESKKNNE